MSDFARGSFRRPQIKAGLSGADIQGSTVRRVLRKLGYPPDQTESAAQLVLEQAEALANDVIAGQHR